MQGIFIKDRPQTAAEPWLAVENFAHHVGGSGVFLAPTGKFDYAEKVDPVALTGRESSFDAVKGYFDGVVGDFGI